MGDPQSPPLRRFRVGYALAPKKVQSFIQQSLVDRAAGRGIDLVPIDAERPLAEQGPFDCVLHKLYGDPWRQQLEDFARANPSAHIVDPPDAIQRLHNRISMLQVVSELRLIRTSADESSSSAAAATEPSFGIPKQIVVYDPRTLFDRAAWDGGLKFPVIAKPLVADGSAKSHKMSLVFNHDGLKKLKPPIVLQEFINHGGVIFKVYVVANHVRCVKRKSLPDVPEEKLKTLEGSLSFSQVSNLTSTNSNEDGPSSYVAMQLDETEMPPQSFISEIARGLRQAMNLNLFNFDVIRDSRIGNRYLVIDINYFPGYAKMPSYESVLTDFFWDVVHNKLDLDHITDISCLDDSKINTSCCENEAQGHGHDNREVKNCASNTFCSDEDDAGAVAHPVSPFSREEKESQIQV